MAERVALVTGGAGYIGAHVCQLLAQKGWLPVAYDNLVSGHAEAVRWGPLIVGDICDRASLDEVMAQCQPEMVMHFAAYASVAESVENPARYYRNNVAGSLTLLEAMKDHGIRKMIFSSTCATYGIPPDDVLINEDLPQKPVNPYGASKLVVEQMLSHFYRAYNICSVALRYFNAAGADPAGLIGELHDPETHLIPLAIQASLGQRTHVTINGTDYETPDGTCIRDYIHVSDLASAHLAAANYLQDGHAGSHAFNLGIGRGYSVRDIIAAVERVGHKRVPIIEGPRRPGDPARLVSNAKRAREILGWSPAFVDLDDIIVTALNWAKSLQQKSS
jgi:UDP-arabinose 4-epimerase